MHKLSDLQIGQSAIIASIPSYYQEQLLAMGLVPGTKITLTRIAPVGDPLEFEIRNYALSLRRETCENVEVGSIE